MTMAEQIVSFPPEVNEKVGQYCIEHSTPLPGYFKEHKEYTEQNVANPSTPFFTLSELTCRRQNGVDFTGSIFRLACERSQSTKNSRDRMFLW